ncbi:hypothetical protein FB45DRAFT_871851 [Roridomyces roridus]|uniref:Retrotransposon Copia-like N-terminal domain-containing protein n=1 Tax=Roridomyces roridus TaxID=1738132 RepID=A0AAD7BED4_9AGAR|nr:hypothetical protein FB45DRAFT_871851 [Roridomyces roridus]
MLLDVVVIPFYPIPGSGGDLLIGIAPWRFVITVRLQSPAKYESKMIPRQAWLTRIPNSTMSELSTPSYASSHCISPLTPKRPSSPSPKGMKDLSPAFIATLAGLAAVLLWKLKRKSDLQKLPLPILKCTGEYDLLPLRCTSERYSSVQNLLGYGLLSSLSPNARKKSLYTRVLDLATPTYASLVLQSVLASSRLRPSSSSRHSFVTFIATSVQLSTRYPSWHPRYPHRGRVVTHSVRATPGPTPRRQRHPSTIILYPSRPFSMTHVLIILPRLGDAAYPPSDSSDEEGGAARHYSSVSRYVATAGPYIKPFSLNPGTWKVEDKLSLAHDNYAVWSKRVHAHIGLHSGATRWLDPSELPPSFDMYPQANRIWHDNDMALRSYLQLTCDSSELPSIEGCTTASAVWLTLQKRHTQRGPIHQVATLRETLAIQFSDDPKSWAKTLSRLYLRVDLPRSMGYTPFCSFTPSLRTPASSIR